MGKETYQLDGIDELNEVFAHDESMEGIFLPAVMRMRGKDRAGFTVLSGNIRHTEGSVSGSGSGQESRKREGAMLKCWILCL